MPKQSVNKSLRGLPKRPKPPARYLAIPTATEGFSYVESLVALVATMVILGVIGSLFMQQRQQNVSNELRTAGAMVAQSLLENHRRDIGTTLPDLTEGEASTRTAMGHTFEVSTRIRDFRNRNADGSVNCDPVPVADSQARCIRIQVSSGGALVYEVETVYTQIR